MAGELGTADRDVRSRRPLERSDRFGVADVLVGTALLFTRRVGIEDELDPSLKSYVGRLTERPAFGRAVERTFG